MSFKLRALDHSEVAAMRASLGTSTDARVAIDEQSGARMFLVGRDVLDPTIPSWYCMEIDSGDEWTVLVVDARYVAKSAGRPVRAGGPQWLAAATPVHEARSAVPTTLIEDGLRTLALMPGLDVVFMDRLPSPGRDHPRDPQQQTSNPEVTPSFALGRRFGELLKGLKRR